MNQFYDDLAQKMFGVPFDKLSAFGQREIRSEIFRLSNHEPNMDDVDLTRALASAHKKIAKLEDDNRELWLDLEELELENIELREKYESSHSGSTRRRQDRDSTSLISQPGDPRQRRESP